MPKSAPIANLVDDLLSREKALAGEPQWGPGNRRAEQGRLHWPVLIGSGSAGCYLAATIYPEDQSLRFTITLNFKDKNIWRLDFEPEERIELNPFLRGHQYSNVTIHGPHCHRWTENRLFATPTMIPEPLPFRVPLEGVRSWESAFRHFIGDTGIGQPRDVPAWPPRERFL